MEYEKLFKEDAFKAIDPKTLELFKGFSKKIKGKSLNETLSDIIEFYDALPKGNELSNKEREALIDSILLSLPKNERLRFVEALEFIGNMIK